MSKIILPVALSAAFALAAAPGPGMAEGPGARERPKTQQIGEPAPRTSRDDTRLSTIFTAPSRAAPTLHAAGPRTPSYSYRPTPPSLLAPGSGPPARARYYSYQPVTPDGEGLPCPTRSGDSLGELFACTMR